MRCLTASLTLALAVLPAAALSPAAEPTPTPPPKPCRAPEHRQFDFWLGEWEVRTPDGELAGRNRITSELGGCVLHESWASARGSYTGQSFNVYRPDRRQWHQSWVDSSGLLLLLDGELRDGRLVLSGEARDAHGRLQRQRITWEPRPDGSVRQLWEQSLDGAAWTTAFDGLYVRQPGPRP